MWKLPILHSSLSHKTSLGSPRLCILVCVCVRQILFLPKNSPHSISLAVSRHKKGACDSDRSFISFFLLPLILLYHRTVRRAHGLGERESCAVVEKKKERRFFLPSYRDSDVLFFGAVSPTRKRRRRAGNRETDSGTKKRGQQKVTVSLLPVTQFIH